jgi:hypothetical protein
MTEQEWGALRREFKTHDEAICEIHRLRRFMDIHSQLMHPWYGPCDYLGPDDQCSECRRVLAHEVTVAIQQ